MGWNEIFNGQPPIVKSIGFKKYEDRFLHTFGSGQIETDEYWQKFDDHFLDSDDDDYNYVLYNTFDYF